LLAQVGADGEHHVVERDAGRVGDAVDDVKTGKTFDPGAGGFDHFGIRVPRGEWKSLVERLEAAEVRIRGRRGRSAIYIEDPNGYTVELYCD
jgi:catechol 2,3-dioxygenase-like lactoylglutathione lyase family enzyme